MADWEDIRPQLRGLELRAAAAIALRSAMRILPILALHSSHENTAFAYWAAEKRSAYALAIFRAYQFSIAVNCLTKNKAVAAYAYSIAKAADNAAADAAASSAADAFAAANAAAFATKAMTNAAEATSIRIPDLVYAFGIENAVSAVANAYDATRLVVADTVINPDIQAAKRGDDISVFLTSPLWPQGMPGHIERLWRVLRAALRSLDAGFDVWIDWYRDRLAGLPLDWELEAKWALLPDSLLKREPAEINTYLQRLRDEHRPTPEPDDAKEIPRDIPEEQALGLQFAQLPDGKIDVKPSGIAPPDDLTEIAAMRGVITEALDDLVATLDGSNAYGSICSVAKRYRSAINVDALSVDLLYAYGVRLENARTRLEREVQGGDYPEMAVAAGEALDSVIALHGPTVYSTKRGRALIEKARAFKEGGRDIAALKPVAEEAAAAIQNLGEAATEGARQVIREAAGEIGEGPHPERSTQIGVSGLVNFMIVAAKVIISECEAGARDGIKNSAKLAVTAGIAAGAYWTYSSTPALLTFFTANAPLLQHRRAHAAGSRDLLRQR